MNQSSHLNEFVETASRRAPSFRIVGVILLKFDQTLTKILKDCYSRPSTKTFHHTKIVNKIHGNLLSSSCPCHSSYANEKKNKSKFIKPE